MATIVVGIARRKAGSWEIFLNWVIESLTLPSEPVLVSVISVGLVAARSAIFSLSSVQLRGYKLESLYRHIHDIFVGCHNLVADVQC